MIKPAMLAVDDDPVNLDIITTIFEDDGYELLTAQSGAAAIAQLEDEGRHFDVVLLDRMMPGMDGLEVLRWIKATPRFARLPIIMQTAAAAPEQVEEGLRVGAYYYLTKPYTPAALRAVVQAALEDTGRYQQTLTSLAEFARGMRFTASASFSFQTLSEAGELAVVLATLSPDPDKTILGLRELLTNAVEHGNLDITYAEKSQLKRDDGWAAEVERRARLPEFRDRRVRVTFQRRERELQFTVLDQGKGFAWEKFLELDPRRVFDPNGRGIALARALSFSRLSYQDGGRTAIAIVELPAKVKAPTADPVT